MRQVRVLGACLVAVFAISAIIASSALAAKPEIGQCFAKAGGKYADSNCTTKAKKGAGAFEWRKGGELAHPEIETTGGLGTLTTSVILCGSGKNEATCSGGEEEFDATVECTSEHGGGKISSGSSLTSIVVRFSGCKIFGTLPCSNSEPEEIVVNPLNGALGYINKSKHEIGVDLTPVTKKGEFAKFICFGSVETVVGLASSKEFPSYPGKGGGDGIISPITPVNKMSLSATQEYTFNPETLENIPNKFEGKSLQVLEDYVQSPEGARSKWGHAGESIVNTTKVGSFFTPEEAEVKG